MKKLITLLLASTCLSPVAPARAEPVSTAIGLTALIAEVGVSTAVAGAIGGAIISTGIAVGSTLIARALQPKPGEQNQTEKGTQTQASIGADVPRNRVYGKQAIAGRLGYWNLFGPDNVFLQLRFDLGAGPHAFFGMFANGKRCTLGATLAGWGQAITDFDFVGVNTAWVNFYAGFYDQATDANLIANAVPAGRYDANNRGRGCCYAIVTLGYKPEVYPQGVPQFQFEIGALLYDPRKDGSTGGAGAHRWTDQHTWEWSDNPALGLYEYERGLATGTHRVIGRGLAPIDILRGSFVDVANICDEIVVNNDASTEKRYRIGMNVGADRELKSVEADFCTAFAGALVEQAGAYGPIAGVAQDVVATFTDADLIQGKPVRYSDKRPRDQLVNALFGAYSEPAQNYQAVPYAPRTSSADESADGDRFAARRDYVQILSQTQAQRVGEIDRREGRYQGTGSVTLGFKYSYLESGDWVRWISARRGFDKLFRVTQHRLAADQSITLALDETAAAVFEFDSAIDELNPLAPGDLPGIGTLIGTVPDLEAEALQLVDATTGLKTPAIRALWSPIVDRTVDRVRLQYRLASQPDAVHDSDPFPPDDGEGIIASGIQAGGAYEIRGTIDTTPVRATTWTAWIDVSAASLHIVPSAQTAAAASAVPAAGIIGQLVSSQIADAAITAAKLAAAAVTLTAFAAGIQPAAIASALPSVAGYTGPSLVFNTTDGKLYRYAAGAFTAAVPTVDLTGQIATVQIADVAITTVKLADLSVVTAKLADAAITTAKLASGAVTATAFASGIEPVSIVSGLPSPAGYTGPKNVFNSVDGKLYRYTGGAFVATIPTVDLTGQIATVQIADAAITTAKIANAAITTALFASGIQPASIVSALPSAAGYSGPSLVYNTTDGKLYRYAAGAFTATVPTVDLTGQITTTQITDSSITTAKVAANAITAAKIAAGTITANEIAADTITAGQIAAGAVATSELAALAVTAAKIAANTITASQIAADTITANEIAANAITTSELAANAVTAAKIAANTITASQIAANTITAGQIAANTLTAGTIAAGAIGTTQLAAGAVTTGILAAGAVTTAKLAVGSGNNLIPNSDFLGGLINVATGYTNTGLPLSLTLIGGGANIGGFNLANVTAVGLAAAGTLFQAQIFNLDTAGMAGYFPASAGKSYEVSGYFQTIGCAVSIFIGWVDSSNAAISFSLTNAVAGLGAGQGLEYLTRAGGIFTAPAGTVKAFIGIQGSLDFGAYNNPLVQMTGAVFAPANANQTDLSPWSPAGATVISGGQIVTDSVTATQIAASAITTNELAANAVTAAKIAANTITASQIAASTITTNELAANAVTAAKIAANTITASQIAANTITAGQIAANTITAGQIAANTLTAGTIAAGAIGTTQLAAGAVTTGILAAGAVTTAKLAVGSGNNQIPNSDVLGGLVNYVSSSNNTGCSLTLTVIAGGASVGPVNMISHTANGTAPNGTVFDVAVMNMTTAGASQFFPVVGGKKYEISGYAITVGCTASWVIGWVDNAGSVIQYDSIGGVSGTQGGAGLDYCFRTGGIVTAPANAVKAQLFYRGYLAFGNYNNPFVLGTAFVFAPASDNQTDLSPWSPGGVTVISGGQIVTNSITASQILANTITAAQIAGATITATQIAASTITAGQIAAATITGTQIAANTIATSHIVGASISVADAGTVAAYTPGGWQDVLVLTLSLTNTVNGSKIPIFVDAKIISQHTTGTSTEWAILVNSTQILYDFEVGGGRTAYESVGTYLTGNGGTVTATIQLQSNGQAGGLNHIITSVMVVAAFKR